VLWSADVPIPAALKGVEMSLCCRATDIAANSQPEQIAPTWNMRGLATNTWDRVTVSVARDE
jgi:sulfite oxidase